VKYWPCVVVTVNQAKSKIVMLKVLKELTGKSQAFPSFGADEPDILRDRRSIQVSRLHR